MNTSENISGNEWTKGSRGVDSVNFQRSAMMTWCSVLMGMAVVVLAEKIVAIPGQIFTQGRWYLLLYVITSGLIIAQSWIQIAWLILITSNSLQVSRAGLSLLSGIAIYITCLSVDNPANWARAAAFFTLVSTVQALNNLRTHGLVHRSARGESYLAVTLAVYICITLLASWHLTVNPSAPAAWLWGMIFMGSMSFYLWLQSRSMAEERRLRNIP